MFGEFLTIIFKSIKLDKTLYSDNKNFGEAAIYFAGLIMILDGIAGGVAANTIVKTAIGMSIISMIAMEVAMNLTDYILTGGAILTWWVIPIMLIVGFLTPWPYNYYILERYNKSCH